MQRHISEGDPTAVADTRECDQQAAAEATTTTVLSSSSTATVAPKQQTQEMQTSKGELSGGRAPTNGGWDIRGIVLTEEPSGWGTGKEAGGGTGKEAGGEPARK